MPYNTRHHSTPRGSYSKFFDDAEEEEEEEEAQTRKVGFIQLLFDHISNISIASDKKNKYKVKS